MEGFQTNIQMLMPLKWVSKAIIVMTNGKMKAAN